MQGIRFNPEGSLHFSGDTAREIQHFISDQLKPCTFLCPQVSELSSFLRLRQSFHESVAEIIDLNDVSFHTQCLQDRMLSR